MPQLTATARRHNRSRSSSTRGRKKGRILVGTASWTDPGFIADWYPKRLPARERLAWYAERFNLVEVNSSFYAVPPADRVAQWCDQTPDGFVFDIKLHRLLSRHSTQVRVLPRGLRSLAGGGEKAELNHKLERALVEVILESIEPLVTQKKLGVLLLQLSPSFSPKRHSLTELDHLLELLDGYQVAVELRNNHWLDDEHREQTVDFFRDRQTTLVGVDGPRGNHFMIMPELDVVTNPQLAYLRAHGRNKKGYVSGRSVAERFDYDYPNKELEEIAERAQHLAELAIDTHIIFNNNKSNYAPKAAERFRKIVAPRTEATPSSK